MNPAPATTATSSSAEYGDGTGRGSADLLYGQRGPVRSRAPELAARALAQYRPTDMLERWPAIAARLAAGEDVTISVGPYTTNKVTQSSRRSQEIRLTADCSGVFTVLDCSELIDFPDSSHSEERIADADTLGGAIFAANNRIDMLIRAGKQYLQPIQATHHTVAAIEAILDALGEQ